jgi:hypothetical protein
VTPDEVLIYLRKRGIVVHLVSRASGGGLTIYLEANYCQMGVAQELMQQLPTVKTIREVSPGILRTTPKQ